MKQLSLLLLLLSVSSAFAQQQQQADPAFMQRAINALQTQRNTALDAAASQQARADGLAEDLAKAQQKIKDFEALPKQSDSAGK